MELIGRVLTVLFGGLLVLSAVKTVWSARRDIGLRLSGERTEATVTALDVEQEPDESVSRTWVLVRFTTRDGRELQGVRLRNYTFEAPRIGSRIRVSYDPHQPQDADRATFFHAAVRVVVLAPILLGCGALAIGLGLGLVGS